METTLLCEFCKGRQQPPTITYPANPDIFKVGVGQIANHRIINPLVQKVFEKIFSLLSFQDRFQL